MKILYLTIALLFLSGCSKSDYSTSGLLMPGYSQFYDNDGQRWIRENEKDFGMPIGEGQAIQNNIIPHCFLNKSQIDGFIDLGEELPLTTNIVWYAKVDALRNGDYFLFGDLKGIQIIKINNIFYINNHNPKEKIMEIVENCRAVQRGKDREKTDFFTDSIIGIG